MMPHVPRMKSHIQHIDEEAALLALCERSGYHHFHPYRRWQDSTAVAENVRKGVIREARRQSGGTVTKF
jgi:hypothetical protein